MPARVLPTVASVVLVMAMAGGLVACSSDELAAPSTTVPVGTTVASTTATTASTTSTTAPPAPTVPPTTPAPTAAPTTPGLTPPPGSPCALGSNPDCIDPLRTGQGVYLIGGAQCMATLPDQTLCIDLDGDGLAGYPDFG